MPAVYANGPVMRSFPTGSNWTASNGLGTATNSTLTLSLPGSTAATAWSDLPRLVQASGHADPWNIDVMARLASKSGTDANTFAPLTLRNSAGNLLFLIQFGSTNVVTVYDSGGLLANAGAIMTFSGSEWFRLTVQYGGHATAWYGTGSMGSQSWVPVWRGLLTIPASSPQDYKNVVFYLYQGSGAAGTVTVQWADVFVSLLA